MVEKAGMIFSPNWEWVVGKFDGKYAGDIFALGKKNVERVIKVEEESDAVYLVRCLNACGAMAITMGDIERAARREREALPCEPEDLPRF